MNVGGAVEYQDIRGWSIHWSLHVVGPVRVEITDGETTIGAIYARTETHRGIDAEFAGVRWEMELERRLMARSSQISFIGPNGEPGIEVARSHEHALHREVLAQVDGDTSYRLDLSSINDDRHLVESVATAAWTGAERDPLIAFRASHVHTYRVAMAEEGTIWVSRGVHPPHAPILVLIGLAHLLLFGE